jgi:outer membrane protein, multidrug efflux system
VKTNTSTKLRTLKLLAATLPAFLLANCAVGPDYKRPAITMPETFRFQSGPAEANSVADLAWWNAFDDKALQALISEGLHNNYDLQVAVARIDQARALVAVSESADKPQLGYQAVPEGVGTFGPARRSVQTITYGAIGGLLDATWEIDVWGRIRRSNESARANLFAQEDIRRGVMLTLVTDLAAGYFRLIDLDRELAIAEDSARTYKKTLDLFTDRYNAGKDSNLPVQRTQALYDASNADIATLKREIATQEDALSVLAGASPRAIERGRVLTEQVTPATPLGATTDLLRRRPDILQAEQAMIGANAEIGVAIANFYPRVGLSALGGVEGVTVGYGMPSFGIWNLAGNVAGPIFTGGRLEGLYHERQAFWDETVAQYKKTILGAFQETSDALAAQQTLVKRREALESQIQALRHSLDIALLRYDSGRASYFEVLQAEQELFPAEFALAQTQRDQLIAVVNLYKALGGGWKQTPAEWAQAQ